MATYYGYPETSTTYYNSANISSIGTGTLTTIWTPTSNSTADNYYGYYDSSGWQIYDSTKYFGGMLYITVPEETPEQKLTRENRERESANRYAAERADFERQSVEAEKARKEASEKATKLLHDYIGKQRFGLLYQVGYLEVESQKYTGRQYRVMKNAYDKIEILENGKVIDRLCIVPTIQCPEEDRLLSKIVLLESDEELVLAKSNHFPVKN